MAVCAGDDLVVGRVAVGHHAWEANEEHRGGGEKACEWEGEGAICAQPAPAAAVAAAITAPAAAPATASSAAAVAVVAAAAAVRGFPKVVVRACFPER